MIPIDVDALLAKTRREDPCSGVTRVTPSGIPSNHAGQETLTAVTQADPPKGNTGNTPGASAADAEAVTRVTPLPPALGNSRIVSQAIDTERVRRKVGHVAYVTQKEGYVAHALETPAVSWRCPCCKGARRWRSVYGAVVCARCHPPADAALVASWESVA